ncbi:MAG: PKD domain-containing protein [Verrucomicrobiota bacterium]|jgi:PKD repeat protein
MKARILTLFVVLSQAVVVQAGAIRNLPGFATTVFGPNDDGSYPCIGPDNGVPSGCTPASVPIGFAVKFFGESFSNLYVNNNGNITFDEPLGVFTPFGLVNSEREIIAPFFADVDTRVGNVVTFGNDKVDGHQAFGVDWIGVGYFETNVDKLDSFELILIDRSDRNQGDFDIEFNYDQIQWETGDASEGVDGLGGFSAVAGFSNGSELPGTSFEWPGSEVPGELLDSNPGGLIHNSFNTNVLGRYVFAVVNLANTVLDVERFSQGDSRWGADAYADSNYTIQQKGCALSCLAMALHYAGIATDPGALNTLMVDNDDFVQTSVDWDPATRDASGGKLEFHGYRTSDALYLSEQLAAGHPVIVGVNLNANGAPGHFVLVIGEQEGQFVINDPGHADATNLDYYDNQFETRGYVGDPQSDVSGLDVATGNAGDILVVDSLGRRTGYDPASGLVLQEIPQSVHFVDCIENNDLTGAPGTNTAHFVNIYQPLQGPYQIFFFDQVSGEYDLDLRSFSQSGASGKPLTFQGAGTSNTIKTFQIDLGATNVASETFTNQCPWSVSPTNGLLPMIAQFSGPGADSNGNAITNWSWNYGDGTTDTGQDPSHTYDSGGIYFPELVAVNNAGSTLIAFGSSVSLPTAQFTAVPSEGLSPLTVQFSLTNIDSEGYALTNIEWYFGDGSTGSGQHPSHTYESPGEFDPILAITNAIGEVVSAAGPFIDVFLATVQFSANPTTGAVPLTVQFSATNIDSGGNAIVNWQWDFGDGRIGTGQYPSHTYAIGGAYQPNLIATNNLGVEVNGIGPSITALAAPYYSGLVLNGGFETGDFTDWILSGGDPVDNFVDDGSQSGISPYSGDYLAALGSSGSLSYLSQTLATKAGARYWVSLWLDSPDGETPNEFLVSWNGNTLFDEANIAAIGWTNLQFSVSATGASTVLEFGFEDDISYLGLDDIGVFRAEPSIGGIELSGANLVFNGINGAFGRTYYVLMSSNLGLPLSQWTRVATNVLSASGNFTMTATNTVTRRVPQRFYILQAQ